MEPFGIFRNSIGRVKPAILMLIFLFCTQGIAASYWSVLPETKPHAPIIKKLGPKAQSAIKKQCKQVALLRGSLFVDHATAISSFNHLQSGGKSSAIQLAIPSRAPPVPGSRET